MFGTIVAWHGFHIIKNFSFGWRNPWSMSAHNFCHVEIAILEMNQKILSVNAMFQDDCMINGFIFCVGVNFITRNILCSKFPLLLDQRRPKNARIMQCNNPHSHTEATIHSHRFASIVDWFHHFQQDKCSLERLSNSDG